MFMAIVIKNLSANAGDRRDMGSTPGSGRSPGGRLGDPLQYSCLENPIDRGAWLATVHRIAKSRTQLKQLSTHAQMSKLFVKCQIVNILISVGVRSLLLLLNSTGAV